MKRAFILMAFLLFFTGRHLAQTVTDADGNVYSTVTIGTQVWMAENLKTTRYSDGMGILLLGDSASWSTSVIPAFCWYSNTALYKDRLGALYNWFAVNSGKLAPPGWHVATDAEWKTLTEFLGGEVTAGGKLKDVGTVTIGTGNWFSPNTGATNQSGFSAVGGGARELDGSFLYLFSQGFWWTATSDSAGFAVFRQLSYNYADIRRGYLNVQDGLSVRCVKDTEPGMEDSGPEKTIRIFPNPADDFLIIGCTGSRFLKMTVFDPFGRTILQQGIDCPSSHIDVTSLQAGVYFVTIAGAGWQAHWKLIKK